MMFRRNSLPAIIVLSAVATSAAAAEPQAWTITITPNGGAARIVSLPVSGVGAPILLAQDEAVDVPEESGEAGSGDHDQANHSDVVVSPAEVGGLAGGSGLPPVRGNYAAYRRVYASIPFSRTEYDANPGYRHEATMELLLGQLRPRIAYPSAPRSDVRVNVGWPVWNSYPQRYGYRRWSRYPGH